MTDVLAPPAASHRLTFVVRLAIGLTILSVAIWFVDARAVMRSLGSMEPRHFAAAVGLTLLSTIVIPAIITSRTLHIAGLRMSLLRLISINLAMRFYVLILPLAVTVGMRWLRYRGAIRGKGWQVAALLLFERVVQGTIVLLAAFGFLLAAGSSVPRELGFLVPLCGALSAGAVGVLLLFVSGPVFSRVRPLIALIADRAPRAVAAPVRRLSSAVADYQHLEHRHVAAVLGWSLAADVFAVASAVVVSRGLGLELGVADLGWMRSVVFLLTILPITVAGIGIREVGYATFFSLYGIDGPVALAYPLVLLSIQLLIGLTGAILETLQVMAPQRWPARPDPPGPR